MPSLEAIDISLIGVAEILSSGKLFVPMYQRSYSWEEQNVRDLFNDIGTAMRDSEKEYFLGSIVIAEKDSDHMEVVDGQQRLATTFILLAAIKDYFHKTSDYDRASDIRRKYLGDRNIRTQEDEPKLRLDQSDNDYFLKRVLSNPGDQQRAEKRPSKESHERIDLAAKIAKQRVDDIVNNSSNSVKELLDLIDYLTLKAKVIVVRVPTYANAFTIFETLNDRGLELAKTDLLKNYLFSLADDRLDEIQHSWIQMFSTIEAAEDEELVLTYLRHFWSSRRELTREKNLYERIRPAVTSKQAAIDLVSNLAGEAKTYSAIVNTGHEMWDDLGLTTKSHMDTLNLMGMVQIRPLLLAVLTKFDDKERKESLRLFVSIAVRLLVYGSLGSGTLESHYSQAAVKVRNNEILKASDIVAEMSGIIPSDTQFQANFSVARVSKNYLARYYLRVLEKQARGERDPELVPNENVEQVNLEHILPGKPMDNWNHIDAETLSAYTKRLGNMALLKTRLNSELKSSSFDKKEPHFADSDFSLTSSIAQSDSWGPEEIEERQKYMAELAVKAWPLK